MPKVTPQDQDLQTTVFASLRAHLGPVPQVGWLKGLVKDFIQQGVQPESIRQAYEQGVRLRTNLYPGAPPAPEWRELLMGAEETVTSNPQPQQEAPQQQEPLQLPAPEGI